MDVARARVSRLVAALGALGESDSSEAQILRDALKQARHSAQEQPISAQIKDTEEFIARSTNRLQVLAQETQRGGAIVEGCYSPVGQVARVGGRSTSV